MADQSNPAKKRRVEHSVQKSVGNTFATIPIQVIENMDMNEFLNSAEDEIRMKISGELDERVREVYILYIHPNILVIIASGSLLAYRLVPR